MTVFAQRLVEAKGGRVEGHGAKEELAGTSDKSCLDFSFIDISNQFPRSWQKRLLAVVRPSQVRSSFLLVAWLVRHSSLA